MKKLANRFAVVTGAGAGIGLAIAELYAAEGATVAVIDIDAEAAFAAAAKIEAAGGKALAFAADIADAEQIHALVNEIASHTSTVSVLVNNAGNFIRQDFRHMEDADWERTLDVHLWGAIRTTRRLFGFLQAAGDEGGASVINLASIMAQKHARQFSGYSTAKAAIGGLSRSLAVELAPYNIRVNYVCPGFVPTGLVNRYTNNKGFADGLLRQIPMRRFGQPQEIAKVALFLASQDSSYMTGAEIVVDGGMSLNLI